MRLLRQEQPEPEVDYQECDAVAIGQGSLGAVPVSHKAFIVNLHVPPRALSITHKHVTIFSKCPAGFVIGRYGGIRCR
jgi:hypothetical protein